MRQRNFLLGTMALILFAASVPQTQAYTQENNSTLYVQSSTTWTMNDVLGAKVDNFEVAATSYCYYNFPSYSPGDLIEWATRLYIKHRNGTAITVATDIALVSGNPDELGDFNAVLNATWELTTDKALQRSSSIYWRYITRQNGGAWKPMNPSYCITASIGAFYWNASTLTFEYSVTTIDQAGQLQSRVNYGGLSGNTYITNFQFDYGTATATEENMEQYFLLGGSMTFLIGFGITLTRRKRPKLE